MVSVPNGVPPHSIEEYRRGYEEEQRLRGWRSACGFVTATWSLLCPQCGQRDLAEADLGRDGRLAAYTVLTVPSDEFVNDAPYAYVLVDLDSGGRVSGWIPGVGTGDPIAIGDRVRYRASYKPGVQFERIGGPEEARA
ncbi:MAG TPA: OB-fold domain-containing protein [Thermoplasmata archaeon]|nr:OB-fold domain-containing protein [Thermoplasmata archaeon]